MPDEPVVPFGLAGAYLHAGQPESAADEYREAIRLRPDHSAARRHARACEAAAAAGKYRRALHGIPCALKDIYDTKGFLTSGHSRVFIARIPGEDATTTSKLYDAGAVLLGKLATHEMAHAGPS